MHGGLNALVWVVVSGTLAGAATLILVLRRLLARLRESARATNARLRAVTEASPAAIVELDEDGRVRLWNRMAERMFRLAERRGPRPAAARADP